MGVLVHGEGGRCVAEPTLDRLDVHAVCDELRGLRVTKLVELEVRKAALLCEASPPAGEVRGIDEFALVRATDRGGARLHDADLVEFGRLVVLSRPQVLHGFSIDVEDALASLALGVFGLAVDRD